MGDKHFTYNAVTDKTALKQGDILQKTTELSAILGKFHQYYADTSEYTHFQVLTQTCDLAPRGKDKGCVSRYITLAAIRNLDVVIERAISKYVEKPIELDGDVFCCNDKYKPAFKANIASLFNNNDKELFFLQASPDDGLLDDSCTFLYLSIALRANEHYDICLDAKCLELKENFRAKLGWMVGNLYSRVGTEDYVPGAMHDENSFKKHIDKILTNYIAWIPKEAFQHFKESIEPGMPYDEIIDKAAEKMEQGKKSKSENLVGLLIQECNLNLTADEKNLMKAFFTSDKAKSFLK